MAQNQLFAKYFIMTNQLIIMTNQLRYDFFK